MRVIAGTYRSRRLKTLRGMAMRPTSDRTRETLFNVLSPDVPDAIFVDAFAGSGAVGIEALSRGAQRSIFIERHLPAVRLLRENVTSLGIAIANGRGKEFAGVAEIIAADALAGMEQLAGRGIQAHIVFADPPYADAAAYGRLLDWLGNSKFIAHRGLVILEHTRRLALPVLAGTLERTREVAQGDTVLSFYGVVTAA